MKLIVVVLGRTLLDVQLAGEPAPTPTPETTDGPVTDRRTPPMLGFAAPSRDPRRPVSR
jgi:hypothetical protein